MGFFSRLFGKKEKKKKAAAPKPSAPQRPRVKSKPDFPLGDNIVDDPDVKTFDDLARLYPLPAGFSYRRDEDGVPYIFRASDGKRFHFLIEAELMTFDEPIPREDGSIYYKTTEVFKQG